MEKMISRFAITPTLFTLLLALTGACARPDAGDVPVDDVPEAERFGGTAVLGFAADIQSMNSLVSSDESSRLFQNHVLLMPLVLFDGSLEAQPWLAERWVERALPPDSLELTFHLRRDVFWHDGVPTTARDVHFTYSRAFEPETAYPNRADFEHWNPVVEVVDSFTVRFRLRAHPDFMATVQSLSILPAHRLEEVPPSELVRHPYGGEPLGNGPFRFVRRVPGQEWVFEANEGFPAALGGRPYLDRVVYRVIPEQTTLLTELLTGRIDAYQPPPSHAERLRSSPGIAFLDAPGRSYTYIGWNTRLPQFSDARVRRALTMAIDRQALVDALLYGYGDVGVSTSTPAHWSYEVQAPLGLPHDPEGARRLLAEAGWRDRDGDGVLENEAGVPLRFTLVTNQGNDVRRDVGEIVQAQLRQIGVAVSPRTLEWNTLVGLLDGSINARGERERGFEAVTSGWVAGFRRDDSPLLHSRHLNDPFHETGYTNPRIDQLLDQLALEADRARAEPLWTEYHQILVNDAPYSVLYYARNLFAHRSRLRNVTVDIRGNLSTIHEWWIAPNAR
jgi:peptide/nickel transport system substrate-binding protein